MSRSSVRCKFKKTVQQITFTKVSEKHYGNFCNLLKNSAPDRIRTSDPLLPAFVLVPNLIPYGCG